MFSIGENQECQIIESEWPSGWGEHSELVLEP